MDQPPIITTMSETGSTPSPEMGTPPDVNLTLVFSYKTKSGSLQTEVLEADTIDQMVEELYGLEEIEI